MIPFPHRILSAFAVLAASLLAPPAEAAIPPEVEAMIREAARDGDAATLATVVKVAQATNPEERDAIAALGARLADEAKANAAGTGAEQQGTQEKLAESAVPGILEGWKGQGEAGAGLTSGNSDELSATIGLSLVRNAIRTRQKFHALLDYQRTNGATSRRKYGLSYGLDYLFRDGLYVYGLAGWEQDRFAGYARRFTQSAGIGLRALKTDAMTLDLDAGPALRQTHYIDELDEFSVATRGSLAWRWTMKSGMQLTQDASVLSDERNTTWISKTALTAALSRALSARVSFNVQSESEPAGGRRPTDTATRASIVYDF